MAPVKVTTTVDKIILNFENSYFDGTNTITISALLTNPNLATVSFSVSSFANAAKSCSILSLATPVSLAL